MSVTTWKFPAALLIFGRTATRSQRRLRLPAIALPTIALPAIFFPAVLLAVATSLAGSGDLFAAGPAQRPPNILILFADDLGYSDLGCYGSEIATPHLDALAENGLRYTQFYNTARCWPSRASLLTGYYAQQVRRDSLPGLPKGQLSGSRGQRPAWAPLLPKVLAPAGYRSYHSGKWHVDGARITNGFSRSLSVEDHNRFFAPQSLLQDDVPLPPLRKQDDYYVTVGIADHAIACLKEHQQQFPNQPFCSYVAFTAPHFPLQARAADIEKYRARYQIGWDAIREARHRRQREMGLHRAELSAREPDVGPPYAFPKDLALLGPGELNRPLAWTELTSEQQAFQAGKMAVHAAMVDCMDQEIGRILQQLTLMQARENTLVLFLSDNGASAEIMVRGDGHQPGAALGSAETFLCLGPGWSTAANTPWRRHKTWVHEGGISTPLIVNWPAGNFPRGELRHSPGHIVDILPTLLELANLSQGSPATSTAPAYPGRSLVPTFASDAVEGAREIWWLHEGNRALRVGDWKIVAAGAAAPWELYNLQTDRSEMQNLAGTHPDKLQQLTQRWTALTAQFRQHAQTD